MTGAPKRFPLGLDDLVRPPAAKGARTGTSGQGGEKANIGAKTATRATVAHAGFNPKPAKSAKPAAGAAAGPKSAKPIASAAAKPTPAPKREIVTIAPQPLARAAALATEQARPHERGAVPTSISALAIRSPLRAELPAKTVRPVVEQLKRVVATPARSLPESGSRAAAGVTGGSAGNTHSTLTSERVRERMVERVRSTGVSDPRVLAAMAAVPRHLFVDPGLATQAYEDAALPIGHHQTISKPSVVARMIELAAAGRTLDTVLEIGTGCGYQAAVLSGVARDVYSIERIRPLHERAKQNLRPLRIPNIRLHYGDGRLGIPRVAPFDAIVIAAAGLDVPQALLEQLQIGGRLIAPVGGESQVLTLVERVAANEWHESQLDRVFFVPLKSGVI
jgi:protein-L-isoaspartate(D-aspartate) O-methyltransferase